MAAVWLWLGGSSGSEYSAREQQVIAGWCLAATASAAIGLLQYLGYAERFSPWVNYVQAGEAYGNLRQRNQQATLLAIGLCATLWWRLQNYDLASVLRRTWHALSWGSLVLLATASAASGSRTGLLQLLLLLAMSLLWRRGRATMVVALLVYVVAAFTLPNLAGLDPRHSGILGRVTEASAPCSSRLVLWSNVLELIAQKPWTGWGWGELAYAHFMHPYAGERFCEIMGNAHNLPLHLAVELGIPVALLVCGITLWLVVRAKPWREQDATRQMAWSVLAVIALHSLLEYPLWYGPFQLAAVLAVWLLWRPRVTSALWPRTAAALILLACSYTAWDYWRVSQIYMPESARAPAYREDTLAKVKASWLFSDLVAFAALGITPVTPGNAQPMHTLAQDMLHYSPEASVVGKLIQSAELLGLQDEAQTYRLRFQAAYPQDYAAWQAAQKASAAGNKAP